MRIVVFDNDMKETVDLETMLEKADGANDPVTNAKLQMLLELARRLKPIGGGREAIGLFFEREVLVRQVTISIDWYDYGPIVNGLPRMHYRFHARPKDRGTTREFRTEDIDAAARWLAVELGKTW